MKKIIYFTESTFSKRDYDRFGIKVLQDRGFLVELWDLTPVLHPNVYKIYEPPDPFNFDGYNLVYDKKSLKESLGNLNSNEIVLLIIGYSFKHLKLYRYLSKKNIHYGVQLLNVIPSFKISNKREFLLKYLTLNLFKIFTNPMKLVNYVIRKFPPKYLGINPQNFILMGGKAALNDKRYPINSITNKIWCHTLDYDLYLKNVAEKNNRVVSGKYAVFLDQFVPFHPDFLHINIPPDCTKDEYYPNINKFLEYVESGKGIKTIIAAHPRSNYDKNPDYFEERQAIRGSTINLIKNSKFVIAHSSTALNFAVLYNKPVIFLTQNTYSERFKRQIEVMAKWFGKSPINLSCKISGKIEEQLVVNKEAYKNYRENYIKKEGTPERLVWEIFADYLEDINGKHEK